MCKLYPKFGLVLLVVVFLSCQEECLDLEFINNQTEAITTWKTDSAIETKTANSSIGISDEVFLTHNFHDFGDSIWDDCGGVSQSFRSTTHYQFFNFPFQLSTELFKQGEENGFWFYLNYRFSHNQNRIQQEYNFTRQASTPANSIIELPNFQLNGQTYPVVLKVELTTSTAPTQLKILYFAKEEGIIRMILNNNVIVDLL